ncbi:glycosyltransferase [Streptomyces sp. NPDC059697]|uniref:glycosyltransferase n=1 Tax=Streptomyces sp. NPDC059697 TaxID=3346912 RepID=UPI003675CA3F
MLGRNLRPAPGRTARSGRSRRRRHTDRPSPTLAPALAIANLAVGLNCADLMVAPAVSEPFGMLYLEAMACGTPPIATATGGPARTITPAGLVSTGWLVAPDDVGRLVDTLVTAIRGQSD